MKQEKKQIHYNENHYNNCRNLLITNLFLPAQHPVFVFKWAKAHQAYCRQYNENKQ